MGILAEIEKIYKASKMLGKIFGFIRKSWYHYVFFSLIVFIICILISIPPLYAWILSIPNHYKIIEIVYGWRIFISLIILLSYALAFLYKIWRLSKETVRMGSKQQKVLDDIHLKLIHDIRDNVKELDDIHNSNRILPNQMEQELVNNCQKYVDYLADFLSGYCKCTVTVTIKKIVSYDKTKAETLVRSQNTKNERNKTNEQVSINKNSDFKFLSDGSNYFYGKADLITAYHNNDYENEEDFRIWSKKYNSTLVTPIRYFSKKSDHHNIELKLEILGFLCIDCMEIKKEWEEKDSLELSLLAIFSDALYLYFDKYRKMKEEMMLKTNV